MRNIPSCLTALLLATSGFALAADSSAGEGSAVHYTSTDGAYFSDSGFESRPETYAPLDKAAVQALSAEPASRPAPVAAGSHFSREDYQYFEGQGFASPGAASEGAAR